MHTRELIQFTRPAVVKIIFQHLTTSLGQQYAMENVSEKREREFMFCILHNHHDDHVWAGEDKDSCDWC